MRLNRWLVVFLVLLTSFGSAQTTAPKTVVVRAGRLLDVKTGKTLTNQIIVIQAGKIASVGAEAQIPTGTQVIDLSNATVLPGLIDAHTHLTMNPNFGYSMQIGRASCRERV